MPVRALLTPSFVDSLAPPDAGELWVADTLQPGFGLRVWSNASGGNKAYAIRGTSASGKPVRRTIGDWELRRRQYTGWAFLRGKRPMPTFGECLDDARRWARDELDRLAGRSTIEQERRAQRARTAARGRHVTLDRASRAVLTNLELAGRSTAYRDRLDKLFALYVPDNIRQKRLTRLKLADLLPLLENPELSLGNRRVLRPFLGRCIALTREVHVWPHRSLAELERMSITEPDRLSNHAMSSWDMATFRGFIDGFESYGHWQQGFCLALYFSLEGPLTSVLAARWDHFRDIYYPARDFHDEGFWRREWRHDKHRWWNNGVTNRANEVFERLERAHEHRGINSDFLFPSPLAARATHIKSVDHVWRQALAGHNVSYLSPWQARTLYDEVRRSHFWDDRERGFEPIREPPNVAETSKKSDGL